jgi:hypothetical protein
VSRFSPREVLCVAIALTASACYTPSARDYEWGTVEGSLKPFFEDPIACACNLELGAADWRIHFGCSPTYEIEDEVGTILIESPLPATANQRDTSYAVVQFDRIGVWPSSGFGVGAIEMEFGSEEFGEQVSKYREVFIWTLDVQEQRICSAIDDQSCENFKAGRATDLRFTCGIGVR